MVDYMEKLRSLTTHQIISNYLSWKQTKETMLSDDLEKQEEQIQCWMMHKWEG